MANPWDNDPIQTPSVGGGSAPAPWLSDPIVTPGKAPIASTEEKSPWESDPISQPAQPGFFQKQIIQPLEQSYQSLRQGSGVTGAKAYQDRLAIFDQIDKAQKEGGSAAVQKIMDLYPDPEIKQYGLFGIAHPEKQQEIRKQYEQNIQAGAEKSAAGTKALEAMPVDPALQGLKERVDKGDWWGVGGYLLQNPGILTRAALGSTLQSAQGIAMAPVMGPTGVGLADMGTQMQSALVDTMQTAGVDMKNPDAIRQALLDPHLMAKARRKMTATGLPILAFDTLTAGIAGRAILPAKVMEKTLGKIGELGLQTGVQAAGGGAGDAIGQIASEGKITDPTSVLLNTLAEIPGGAPEALALGMIAGKYNKGPDTKAPMAEGELNKIFQQDTGEGPITPQSPQSPNSPSGETITPTQPTAAQENTPAYWNTLAEREERLAFSLQQGPNANLTPQEQQLAINEATAMAKNYRDKANQTVSPGVQTSIEATKAAITQPLTTIAQRVAALPSSDRILQQTPGVSGPLESLTYARQASRMRDVAAAYEVENRPEAAKIANQSAVKYMMQAEAKGFTYQSPEEAARQGFVKDTMTSVGTLVKPSAEEIARQQYVNSRILGQSGVRLQQNPSFYQNPIEVLTRNIQAQPKQVAPNLQTVGDHPNLSKAVKFTRSLASRIMPRMKLIIDARDDSRFALPGMGGSYTGFKGNYGVIHIHSSILNSEALLTQVLTHELGHAIVHYHWGDTPTDQQQAIYAAFGRHLMKVFGPDATAKMFLDDLHGPFTLATMQRIYESKLNQGSTDFLRENFYSSWYSFDEWIAEQASKWMFTNRRVVTLMDRFFKSIGDAFAQVLKITGRGLPSFEPEAEVKAWLNSMMERRARNEMPLTVPGALEQYKAGVEENAKALGIPPGIDVIPPQAETIPLRSLGMKMPGIFTSKSLAQADKWSGWIKLTNNLLQIASLNPQVQGLQSYTESTRAWWITKMKLTSQAVGRLREWGKLGKEMGNNLSKFIFDIDSMSYLPQGQNPRWPTTPELVAMAKKNGVNREAVDLYMKIKQDFLGVLDQVEAAWVQDAARSFAADPLRMSQAIAEIHSDVMAMRAKPYFPHERFGKWTIKVRDKGKLVSLSHAESEREAIRIAKSVQQANPGMQVSSGKLPEELQVFQGLPPGLIRQLSVQMQQLPGGLSPAQVSAMDELAFAMSPTNSFAKKFMRRKGTPGFSMDARRAYASYFLHAGGHIARLREKGNLESAIQAVRDSANAMTGVEAASAAGERMGIADWMKRHLDYIMNPPNEWTALRGVGFFQYLWGNVSSALMNLVQVPMFTLPYLSARFGDVSSMNELRKAALDLHKTINLSKSTLPQDEIQAISLGVQQEFLDESFATELVSMAQGGVMQRMMPGTQVQRGLMNLLWAGSWMFQKAEQINRRTSFLAAYRLGKLKPGAKHLAELVAVNQRQYKDMLGQGWSPENAATWLGARQAVERSQFEYAQFARPEFVRGKKGVVFAFWMWKQNALWFFKNDPGRYRAMVTMLAMAGILGLPLAGDINDLVRYLASLAGKNFNPEQEARQLLAELHVNPDIVLHGAGHDSFGMAWAGQQVGIPIPSVDVSQRLGMGQMIPGLHEFTSPVGSFAERSGNAMKAVLGAIYGIPLTMLKAAESNDPHIWHEVQQYLPVAFKNFAKTMDVIEHGGVVTPGGAKLVDFDITDVHSQAELAAMALGFNPTRVARAWDEKSAIVEAIAYWQGRRAVLFQQFADARFSKDREAIADAREAIREFNRTTPDGRLKISVQDLLQSLRNRQQHNIAVEKNRAGTQTYEGVAKEIRKGYPSP